MTCPALPLVATFGESPEEARRHAADAIETALAAMIDDGDDIPAPEDTDGESVVGLPLPISLKMKVYRAFCREGITRAELVRRLGLDRESVDQLFRLDQRSSPEQVEAAFAAIRDAP